MVYPKLHPHLSRGNRQPALPPIPLDETYAIAMNRTRSEGTVVEDGRRLFARNMGVESPAVTPGKKDPLLHVIEGFLTPHEVEIMRRHTAARAVASRKTFPVVCILHRSFHRNAAFARNAMKRDAPMCLDPFSPASRRLARRLSNITSISLASWPTGVERRPNGGAD